MELCYIMDTYRIIIFYHGSGCNKIRYLIVSVVGFLSTPSGYFVADTSMHQVSSCTLQWEKMCVFTGFKENPKKIPKCCCMKFMPQVCSGYKENKGFLTTAANDNYTIIWLIIILLKIWEGWLLTTRLCVYRQLDVAWCYPWLPVGMCLIAR